MNPASGASAVHHVAPSKKELLSPYTHGLPKRFKRVGQHGCTWDLPRSFAGYKASSEHEMSIGGAATKCFLSIDGALGGSYIAKFAHKNDAIETYTELFNNQLGLLLGFEMAHSGVARLDGVLHFVSRSFRTKATEQLLHASLLVEELGLADRAELESIKTAHKQQQVYDIEFVESMTKTVCGADGQTVFAALVEMLIFDALIGSMDRHPRNWGVIRTATQPARYRFSPIYDSARALLWDLTDAKLKMLSVNPDELDKYIRKSYPRIGLPSSVSHGSRCTHLDLVDYLVRTRPSVTRAALEMIDIDISRIAGKLVQSYPFGRVFSSVRKQLIVRILQLRREALLHLTRGGDRNNATSLGT